MLRRAMIQTVCIAIAIGFPWNGQISEAAPLVLEQERDGVSPSILSASERAELGDPFFNLLLRDHAEITNLHEILERVQPSPGLRLLFAVDERIGTEQQGGRRAVIAFTGENSGEQLEGNVMLSLTFGPNELPQDTAIEAWGWDNHRGRYNYYKLDRVGVSPGLPMNWKFRGSSEKADLFNPEQRQGTCMACHINGAPVMKELLRPWNNWHSLDFNARYLSGQGATNPWPISRDETFKNILKPARQLDTMIIRAVRRFNTWRINQALKRRDDTGDIEDREEMQTVMEGRRLLRPLFEATEFNIISALQRSNLDPWGEAPGPSQKISIPNSFFLNVGLIAGGGPATYNGLKITEASRFTKIAVLDKTEYKELVETFKIQFNGMEGRDAVFAWFVPEPSHIDNDLIDRLLRRGIITPHFLAALLAIDLETPLYLSEERVALLEFMPNRFSFRPLESGVDPNELDHDPESDELTRLVTEKIEAVPEDQRSPMATDLLTLLKQPNAREVLKEKTQSYLQRIENNLTNADTAIRKQQIRDLFLKAIKLRNKVVQHPVLGRLDETNGRLLLPLPATMPNE